MGSRAGVVMDLTVGRELGWGSAGGHSGVGSCVLQQREKNGNSSPRWMSGLLPDSCKKEGAAAQRCQCSPWVSFAARRLAGFLVFG